MPAAVEFVRFAYHPTIAPVRIPLIVEPITMPTIPVLMLGSLGADTSADRPSKTPSTPPSTSPRTGLVKVVSPCRSITRRSAILFVCVSRPHPQQEQRPHEEIGGDQRQRRPIRARQPSRALERAFFVRLDAAAVEESPDVGGQILDALIPVVGPIGGRAAHDRRQRTDAARRFGEPVGQLAQDDAQ